jgi:hypothetical protein
VAVAAAAEDVGVGAAVDVVGAAVAVAKAAAAAVAKAAAAVAAVAAVAAAVGSTLTYSQAVKKDGNVWKICSKKVVGWFVVKLV